MHTSATSGTLFERSSNTRLVAAAFLESRLIQDGVVRNLEIVGEAVKGLSAAMRSRAPTVPWRRIAGMRDALIHHYFGVDLEVVWRVVEVEAPALLTVIERLISESDQN